MALFSFGKEKEEYRKKIEELEKKLEIKEGEIANLLVELEKANNKVSPKQFEIIEKNIKTSQEKANRYSKIISSFGLNPDKNYYNYKLEISKFYSGVKFKEVVEVLEKNNIEFVDDLTEVKFHSILNGVKNIEEARTKFLNYRNGKLDWETATFKNRGEKITKIYSATRLRSIFSDLGFEYMDDLSSFDFSSLRNYGFDYSKIEDFKKIRDKYYQDRRIDENKGL